MFVPYCILQIKRFEKYGIVLETDYFLKNSVKPYKPSTHWRDTKQLNCFNALFIIVLAAHSFKNVNVMYLKCLQLF